MLISYSRKINKYLFLFKFEIFLSMDLSIYYSFYHKTYFTSQKIIFLLAKSNNILFLSCFLFFFYLEVFIYFVLTINFHFIEIYFTLIFIF